MFSPVAFTAHPAGTVFDVTGTVSNYFGLMEIFVGDTGSITPTGTGSVGTTTLAADEPDLLQYQSMLVKFENVTAVTGIDDHGQVQTDAGVYIDNLLYDFSAEEGTTWSSVTGPLYYTSYDDVPEYLVEPRNSADLVE